MTHLSINTGLLSFIPTARFERDDIRPLIPMVVKGGDLVPGGGAWRTMIQRGNGVAVFDVRRGKDAVVAFCCVAWSTNGAGEAWETMDSHYLNVTDEIMRAGHTVDTALDFTMPPMPTSLPWVASWILPQANALLLPDVGEQGWLDEFVPRLAAAIIHRAQRMSGREN